MKLIDADALKEEINREVRENCVGVFVAKRIFNIIDNAPTVDLWQMRQEATENALKKAEVLYARPQYNFCPNCGADIRGDNK